MDRKTIQDYLIKEIINENKGKKVNILVPLSFSRRLETYQSMRNDLLLASDGLEKLKEVSLIYIEKISLFHTSINFYSKCFNDAGKTKSPKLETKDCRFDNEQLKKHQDLINLRNDFIAHRGETEYEVGIAYLEITQEDNSYIIKTQNLKRAIPDQASIVDFTSIIQHVIKIVEEKYKKEGKSVYERMKKLSREEINNHTLPQKII